MLKRLMALLAAVAMCVAVLTGCNGENGGMGQQAADLEFSNVEVGCEYRDGNLGARYVYLFVLGEVTNKTGKTLGDEDMPILSSVNERTKGMGILESDELLSGETSMIWYGLLLKNEELDNPYSDQARYSFSCELSTSGLEGVDKKIDEELQRVIDEYAEKEAAEKTAAESGAGSGGQPS